MNVTLVCSHRFDCEFVISEVNANIHYYVKTDSGFKLAGSNNDKVGKNMSTKAIGSESRLIVTSNYKFPREAQRRQRQWRGTMKTRHLQWVMSTS